MPGGEITASPIAIGDLQGCFDCLERLLAEIEAQAPGSRLWFTGDLVNRGPRSLQTLRWARQHHERLVTVLGNHDLHLLAVAAGIRGQHRSDTLADILAAPDRDDLIDWLRRQPLAHRARVDTDTGQADFLMVHAGVLPQWDADTVVQLAGEVQAGLASDAWQDFLRDMYGNEPRTWRDDLAGADRQRVIINALTRLRLCTADGTMDFATKEGPGAAPPGHLPWFDVPNRATTDVTVVFGHWSTLGLVDRPDVLGLDTGCVWGGRLTGVRLGDRRRFQIGCPQAAAPG